MKRKGIDRKMCCPKCDSTEIVAVEYRYPHPCTYDGTSEYRCEGCGYREGRWSGKELGPGEHEPVYGERHVPSCPEAVPAAVV